MITNEQQFLLFTNEKMNGKKFRMHYFIDKTCLNHYFYSQHQQKRKKKLIRYQIFFIFFPLFIHCAIENERKTSNCKKQTREEKKN